MKDTEDGVTQKCMYLMAGVDKGTVSRALYSKKVNPLPSNSKVRIRYPVWGTREVVGKYVADKLKVKKKVQCFYNFKGGVGKTSICFQVVSHLALMGFNVLAIDADPQGHLSTSLGFNNNDRYYTLHDALSGIKTIDEIIHNVYEGFDCIPANLSLTKAEVLLNDMPKREERIQMLLQGVAHRYDFIIFDTNPTISYLNRNVITCSELINLVVETQAYSLNGVKLVLSDIKSFMKSMMMEIPDILMIPNKFEERSSTSSESMSILTQFYPEYLKPDFAVRKSEEINIAARISKPLAFFCKFNSIAFQDIIELIYFLLSRSCYKR